jgi:chemotaxis protein methyltransferase CheR
MPNDAIEKQPEHPNGVFMPKLNLKQFRAVQQLVYQVAGINLNNGKEGLVKARLMKRLRALHLSDFDQYFNYLESDGNGDETAQMVDALTTNRTYFFRESEHYDYLRNVVLPGLDSECIRVWSTGCSSGEEPYSLAITLMEANPRLDRRDVKILATDISRRMIEKARRATYGAEQIDKVPFPLIHKYFEYCAEHSKYTVRSDARNLVHFARLNLMDDWPMTGQFDVIFCRNVMIYFDRPTQKALIQRLWSVLKEGGHLMIGHSESLLPLTQSFKYIKPAVYRRISEPGPCLKTGVHQDA